MKLIKDIKDIKVDNIYLVKGRVGLLPDYSDWGIVDQNNVERVILVVKQNSNYPNDLHFKVLSISGSEEIKSKLTPDGRLEDEFVKGFINQECLIELTDE